MGRPALEVADIFRIHGPVYREAHGHVMSSAQRRVMRAIEICRTAVLGGHVDKCDRCGHRRISYNANGHRETKLALCRELLGAPQVDAQEVSAADDWKTTYEKLTGQSLTICPACHQGQMVTVEILPPQKQPQGIDSS